MEILSKPASITDAGSAGGDGEYGGTVENWRNEKNESGAFGNDVTSVVDAEYSRGATTSSGGQVEAWSPDLVRAHSDAEAQKRRVSLASGIVGLGCLALAAGFWSDLYNDTGDAAGNLFTRLLAILGPVVAWLYGREKPP